MAMTQKVGAKIPLGLMPGIAAQVVRAKENCRMVSAEWEKISGWWQGIEVFITPG